ncbi:MAG: hypothetical protein U9R15_14180, partial [Chloroflexota bacterium]|nr:hypothetical protein [Chloroflexota bacterium]
SGSSVLGNDEDVDTTTIVGDLRLHNRLYVNYNGAPGDDYIYFYSGSSVDGAHLMWDDSANAFAFNKTLSMGTNKIHDVVDPTAAQDAATKAYVDSQAGAVSLTLDDVCDTGNTTDQDIKAQNFYINYDGDGSGGDEDSFLYFYDNSSGSGQSLMWDDDPGEFVLSDVLSMSTHKIVDVVDPTADQDVATKKYVDDTTGAVSFTLDQVCDNGNTTDQDIKAQNFYINHDGADGDSFLYFYDTSATGQSLMWDDDPGEFVLSDVLSMNTHKIVDVVDPTAAQDVATKKYVDDTAGAVSFTLDDVCENGATTDVAIISTASGSSFASLLDTGDLDVWGNIIVDGTVDGVDIAGFATAAQTFTGMDDASDSTPTYSSNNYVTNGESLETAIGDLDAAIGNVDIAKEVERLSVAVSSGSEHTIPGANNHAAGDGSSMDIYLNGQLLQSNTGTELRDYLESGTDKVKFTFVIPSNSYLTYIIRS